MLLSVQRLVNRLSLRQLQVFHAVYQERGYGKAADLLGLTQPAVSAQIRHLEEALNTKLFEFIGRRLHCTPAGELVASCTQELFRQFTNLQADLHALQGQISGELRIAVVNTAQYVMPYLLKPFLDLHPNVTASVYVGNRAQAIERLNENRDDLVMMGMVPANKPLDSLPFLDNDLIPVLPADHPLAQQEQVTPAEFLSQNLLMRERGSGSRLALELHCQQQQLSLQGAMEIGSNAALKYSVLAGMGVAVLPHLSVLSELQLGSLKTIPLEGFPLRRSWCLVTPSNKQNSLVTRTFLEYVQSNLGAIKEQFEAMVAVVEQGA